MPAAAVIPAERRMDNVVAVKTFVVIYSLVNYAERYKREICKQSAIKLERFIQKLNTKAW